MTDLLNERLEELSKKYEYLNTKLINTGLDVQELKDLKKSESILDLYKRYIRLLTEIEESKLFLNSDTLDIDLRYELEADIESNKSELINIENTITEFFAPHDPNDDRNAIIEIRGAVGGEEGNLFASDLYDMYVRFAHLNNFTIDILDEERTEANGIDFIAFKVIGDGAYSKFKFESGVHRVQRVPKTEAKGRIHTSTATVLVIPEIDASEFKLNMDEVEIQTCHASGAGGQHINKTSSAIRAIHIPTGITVFCQSRRSQLQNKDEALRLLAAKLSEKFSSDNEEIEHKNRILKLGSGERSEKIRTYNFPQNRVTDHRINYSSLNLNTVLLGNMNALITALKQASQQE